MVISIACYITCAVIALLLVRIWYRLFLHPLAPVPGPKLAACSSIFEFIVDCFHQGGGRYHFVVRSWHSKYGPIVRVGPNEVHILDSGWLRTLYAQGKVRERDPSIAHSFGSTFGTFGTVSHHVHKKRRAALAPWFSQRAVSDREHWLDGSIEDLCHILNAHASENAEAPIELGALLYAWSVDAVTSPMFDRKFEHVTKYGTRERLKRLDEVVKQLWPVVRLCPWIIPTALQWPEVAKRACSVFLPALTPLLDLYLDMRRYSQEIVAHPEKQSRSLIHAILASNAPPAEKTAVRMSYETVEIFAAGSGTSARIIKIALYHILANSNVLAKLREELCEAIPQVDQMPRGEVLLKLRYLTAVCKEALRISHMVLFRSATRAPQDDLYFGVHKLPAGTTISMTPALAMIDEAIYEYPHSFIPERWLRAESQDELNQFWLPFGLGNRRCVGMNFALVQMQKAIAIILRRFDMDLFETHRDRDIDHSRVWAVGEPSRNSKGLRVKIRANNN